jgi:hypothetical protein
VVLQRDEDIDAMGPGRHQFTHAIQRVTMWLNCQELDLGISHVGQHKANAQGIISQKSKRNVVWNLINFFMIVGFLV